MKMRMSALWTFCTRKVEGIRSQMSLTLVLKLKNMPTSFDVTITKPHVTHVSRDQLCCEKFNNHDYK